jgi:hypothetical protein
VSRTIDRDALLALLNGDAEVLDALVGLELVSAAGPFGPEQVEVALVARTLVRELEVNWPGVEVILRLRAEAVSVQRQVRALLRVLAEAQARAAAENGPSGAAEAR